MRTAGTLPSILSALLITASCASGPGPATVAEAPAASDGEPVEAQATAPLGDASSAGGPAAIFSEAQAVRGRATFRAVCAECHYSSEFRGTQFQFSWRRRTVGDFLEEITSTMPEDAPGSLERSEYLDVVAYVLELNGFPAGEAELPSDPAVLETHSMAAPTRGPARAR